jgi:hypothetical protein
VEVVNKHGAKYLVDFVTINTLDWEALILAMAQNYDKYTFFLKCGVDHRTPHFNSTPNYIKKFASDLTRRLKKAQIT